MRAYKRESPRSHIGSRRQAGSLPDDSRVGATGAIVHIGRVNITVETSLRVP